MLLRKSLNMILTGNLKSLKTKMFKYFDELKEYLTEIDKTLTDPVERSKQRTLQYFAELKGKAESARLRRHEATLNQLQRVIR